IEAVGGRELDGEADAGRNRERPLVELAGGGSRHGRKASRRPAHGQCMGAECGALLDGSRASGVCHAQPRRVTMRAAVMEGIRQWCQSGHHNICDTMLTPGVVSWGGYGRRAGVPFADVNLVPLPESIGFVEAASMGCRYMTAFHGVVDQAKVGAGEWVAVHGCGGVGLSAVQIATALGANVIAVDVADEKLAFAKELGAVATVNATKGDPAAAILDLTRGGAHVSIDALGIAATCRNSVNSLRKRGRHLQIG